ncbi:hypothetical protein [Actinomadura rupiterrae]|uniref:hypothetical protein n=1 Tax=Actinomadura rupiterrae TaxID=559627 RepID=UPI0020A3CD32|nr:hypothetical protein [Actinomadura rupiterrae]MCP2338529.1 hypothetical protein [Actinomadura rupiterrae]
MNGPSAAGPRPQAAIALLPLAGMWTALGVVLFHGPLAAAVSGTGVLLGAVVAYRTTWKADAPQRHSARRAAFRAALAGLGALAVSGAVYAVGASTGGGDASTTASGVIAGVGAVVLAVAAVLAAASRGGRR